MRAKACNLVGNLCKHSPDFYDVLRQGGMLPQLGKRCADIDAATRKFACFAVGNAGFHSSELYPDLATCIAPLVGCLADADAKTCANAAGALGNLARNGAQLDAELTSGGVPRALLALALHLLAPAGAEVIEEGAGAGKASAAATSGAEDGGSGRCSLSSRVSLSAFEAASLAPSEPSSEAAGGGMASRLRPSRTALFSLGNLAAHAECRAAMAKLHLDDALRPLVNHHDGMLKQYAARVLQKMAAK